MTTINLVADLGHGWIKGKRVDGTPTIIKAQYALLSKSTKSHQADVTSPLIEWNGERYHYGCTAELYGYTQNLASKEKESYLIPALFTLLPPLDRCTDYNANIILLHHTPDLVYETYEKLVNKLHTYSYNGCAMRVHVS